MFEELQRAGYKKWVVLRAAYRRCLVPKGVEPATEFPKWAMQPPDEGEEEF